MSIQANTRRIIPNDLLCEYVRRRRRREVEYRVSVGQTERAVVMGLKIQPMTDREIVNGWTWLSRKENREKLIAEMQQAEN